MYVQNIKVNGIMNAIEVISISLGNLGLNDELKDAINTLKEMKQDYEIQLKESEGYEKMYKDYYEAV